MNTTVKFENVSKRYQLGLTRTSLPTMVSSWIKHNFHRNAKIPGTEREFWALKNLSFTLHEGESLALLGANGAGKTTALKLLASITKPTAGQIQINGQLSALIELGAGFHPDLTGRENIFLNGTILGIRRKQIEQHLDEIIEFSEIEKFIDTPVKRYSSGMQVRLGFAVASCIRPEILLIDEVLAVGDAAFQQKCMKRINDLIKNGTSIIFVSHNFYLIQAVCDRALYLEKGQVKFDGATREAIDLYEADLHNRRAHQLTNTQSEGDDKYGEIVIERVEVWGGDGSQTDSLHSYQAAQVRIHYTAYRDFEQLHASLFLMRADGMTCAVARTKLDDFYLSIKCGQGMVTLHLDPLQVVSGSYYAEAWFLDETDSMGLTPIGVRSDWFSVKGKILTYDDNSGVFEPLTRWSHQPRNPKLTKDQYIAETASVRESVI